MAIAAAAKAAGGSLEGAKALLSRAAAGAETAATAAGGSFGSGSGICSVGWIGAVSSVGGALSSSVKDLGVIGRGRGGRVTLQPMPAGAAPVTAPSSSEADLLSASSSSVSVKRGRLEALMAGGKGPTATHKEDLMTAATAGLRPSPLLQQQQQQQQLPSIVGGGDCDDAANNKRPKVEGE